MENQVRSPHEVHTKTCTICDETFLNETYIEQHVKSYHEASPFNTDIIRERTLFCDNASEPTPDFCDEQIPRCEQCAYTCNTYSKLKTHVSDEHTASNWLYCELCDSASPENATINPHLEKGHVRNFSLFYCELI